MQAEDEVQDMESVIRRIDGGAYLSCVQPSDEGSMPLSPSSAVSGAVMPSRASSAASQPARAAEPACSRFSSPPPWSYSIVPAESLAAIAIAGAS
jgi:hypothetical protein